ncbi:sugar transferase [Alkalihalobacillus pseudalcaliphilus]|uniref:sugar transferase n=1 Tax=Alkalihalobacillus pseudalcaliphilus TaxID=79884 RepID=UPI00064DE2DC|nr:sugar transferase [Alkalihalobacillus pseudalcaliphilus]KMK75038.1 sugar transferase [Alkalihalobacillus pseudalcaliphilus]
MKRIFDCLISLTLFIVLLPLYLLIYYSIRFKLGKPVIFKQLRPGLDGELFVLYKFRTMNNAVGKDGHIVDDHLRMTSLGKLLRKYSLDELPQLLNVMKGELSLVGPRPLLVDYLPLYSETQKKRHNVRPGITGWAQVNGRNTITWEEKFELDVWYVDNRTFLLDLKIILLTLYKVFKTEGVNQSKTLTMERFRGTQANSKIGGGGEQ